MTQSKPYPLFRRWRRGAAFKQKEIARLIGLRGHTLLSKMEQSDRVPGLAVAIALEVLTGMSLAELFRPYYETVEEETLARVTAMLLDLEQSSHPAAVMKCRHLRSCQERVITRLRKHTTHVQKK